MSFDPKEITKDHVLRAVEVIENENVDLIPSTRWLVEVNEKTYPPKEVMRYARKEYDGSNWWDYSGGDSTNKYLERMGFKIIDMNLENTINLKNEFAGWLLTNAPDSYNYYLGGSKNSIEERLNEIQSFFSEKLFEVNSNQVSQKIQEIKLLLSTKERRNNPEFLEYDKFHSNGIPKAVMGKNNYLKFLKNRFNKHESVGYWIFQCNPAIYDLGNALKNDAVHSWRVAAHKDKIKRGDKAIIWVTGSNAKCLALGEILSEPGYISETSEEKEFYLKQEGENNQTKVQIKITHNFIDNPIYWNDLRELPEFKNFKAGNQGTNFTATKEEFITIKEIGEAKSRSFYAEVKKQFPREKVETFLNILRQFVIDYNLDPEDERVSFNVRPERKRLVFIIGNRYALMIQKKRNETEFSFISPRAVSEDSGSFTGYTGEIEMYWNKVSDLKSFEKIIEKAFRIELKRDNKTPYRKFTDLEFIADVFNKRNEMKTIHLNGNSVYKLSMGKFLKDPKLKQENLVDYFEENSLGVMDGNTKKGQGERFREKLELNDIVYVTYGQDKLGSIYRVIGEPEKLDDYINEKIGDNDHLGRKLEEITAPKIGHTRDLIHDRRDWLPSGFSTLVRVPDIEEANKILFSPFYGIKISKNGELREAKRIDDNNNLVKGGLNRILYGPPGTGKTFKLQNDYFDAFTVRETTLSRNQYLENIVSDLTWWQVIAIVLLDIKKSKVNDISTHELLLIKAKLSNNKRIHTTIWGNLQHYTNPECEFVNVADRSSNPIFYKDENSFWEVQEELLAQYYPEAFSIIEEVKNFQPNPDKLIKNYEFVTFHQSFSYEDFIEGIKPKLEEQENEVSYEIQDGIFKKLCLKADADRDNDYAIFIDEINRGNVSAIFGELITLIEKDKRLDEENELRAKLPYSKKELGVPPNLYIFGTMNTADRSVEALDTALRRRFAFEEVMPIPHLLKDIEFDGFNLCQVLTIINERIEALIDRDHTIGHSYFIKINSGDVEALQQAFENKVIPLLQEYFYHDYEKMAIILGEGFVEQEKSKVKFAKFKNVDVPQLTSSFKLKPIEDIEVAINALLKTTDEES